MSWGVDLTVPGLAGGGSCARSLSSCQQGAWKASDAPREPPERGFWRGPAHHHMETLCNHSGPKVQKQHTQTVMKKS